MFDELQTKDTPNRQKMVPEAYGRSCDVIKMMLYMMTDSWYLLISRWWLKFYTVKQSGDVKGSRQKEENLMKWKVSLWVSQFRAVLGVTALRYSLTSALSLQLYHLISAWRSIKKSLTVCFLYTIPTRVEKDTPRMNLRMTSYMIWYDKCVCVCVYVSGGWGMGKCCAAQWEEAHILHQDRCFQRIPPNTWVLAWGGRRFVQQQGQQQQQRQCLTGCLFPKINASH